MDPTILLGLAGLAAGRGGSTKLTANQNTLNSVGVTTPTTQTFGLSLNTNPTIASMLGGGLTVAPASGSASLPQTVSPTVSTPMTSTASPSQSASDGAGGGFGYLPSSSPLGNLGIGSGFAPARVQQPANDLLLLLLIGGVAVFLLME